MSALFDNGISRYGTVTFPVETETTGISIIPQYDSAGRTVVHNTYTLTLEALFAGRAIDLAIRNIVRQLTKPAYPFIYAGRGLGVAVNIGNVRDVVWGPKPLSCEVKPLGGGNAVKLTWKVQFCIPDCGDAAFKGRPAEYCYTLSFSLDEAGYTRRTYTGHVRIPMTRGFGPEDRRIPDSADAYRDEVDPPLLIGFRRESREFVLSEDKATLNFTIVDVQLPPNVPPPGVIAAEASHSCSSVPGKLRQWNCTLSAQYELAEGSGMGWEAARSAYFRLLKDRVGTIMLALGLKAPLPVNSNVTRPQAGGNLVTENKSQTGTVIPIQFTVDEPQIYGRRMARFSCSYQVTGTDLATMLAYSGQFRPVPDSNWRLWAASLGSTITSRGTASLRFAPGDDAIIDLCAPSSIVDLTTGAGRIRNDFNTIPPGIFPEPTPEASWLGWENEIYLEPDNGTVPVLTLATKKLASTLTGLPFIGGLIGQWAPAALDPNLPNVPPPAGVPWKLPKDDVFFRPPNAIEDGLFGGKTQQRRQSAFLYMVGRAARAWFGIPCPQLVKWGKTTVTPANRPDRGEGFWAGCIGDVGVPVYGARWKLRYWVPELPPGVDLPVSQPPMSKQ